MILGTETGHARSDGAAISELGFDVELFDGGKVVETRGDPDAALRQSSSLCEQSRSGLAKAQPEARETFNSNRQHGAVVLEALPLGEGATGV